MTISDDLVELLRCPESGQKLRLSRPNDAEDGEKLLISEDGKLAYPIRDTFPVLLKEEAIRCG